jgi:hypothetical protein
VVVAVSVGVFVGVSVGVRVGVAVCVAVGLLEGVFVGVLLGVSVGVLVGVAVGVTVGKDAPCNELTTSPAELLFRFHVPRIFRLPLEDNDTATAFGELAELTVPAPDHEEYGLVASVYMIVPLSRNQLIMLELAVL